ncbi:rho GTPase-activating protein 8 isoform X3 [Vombatus ursinus]|uniref:rho GTPase-activating protein 8 isoform X3 n=1 Tax=Vombatus ursinus TaxID=29139 RepID=UPI000FFD930B|nr:rho GTPase-activating protein 8 isoform X3 [Vombatus ursinus]
MCALAGPRGTSSLRPSFCPSPDRLPGAAGAELSEKRRSEDQEGTLSSTPSLQAGLASAGNMSGIDLEALAEIELQKEEEEATTLGAPRVSLACTPACKDSALGMDHPYYDVARHGILHLAGDDNSGRRVITFSCCRMPPSHELNHSHLLGYLKYTLDQYVENDYTIVYFHYGLTSRNKPSLSWLQSAYKELGRKYKKNLKALYVVHPTNFIKILWTIFKPLISHKFGKKVTYFNYLSELREHLKYDQLMIPPEVIRHDEKLQNMRLGRPPPLVKMPPPRPPLPTQQFGVSLKYLRDKNKGELIPPVMKETVTYLKDKGLRSEGLFRRSANVQTVKEIQRLYNQGVESSLRVTRCKEIVGGLPEHNYAVLKYLMGFLHLVSQECIFNKMTGSNLACVFGLNLIWPSNGASSLNALVPLNLFTELMIDFYENIFSSRVVPCGISP